MNDGDTVSRVPVEVCAEQRSKACREKRRRDRLNDRFIELSSIMEPGGSRSSSRVATLSNAIHLVKQLPLEVKKLNNKKKTLQELIKILKAQKMQLRQRKLRLKAVKQWMEQMINSTSIPPTSTPQFSFYAIANDKPILRNGN